MSNDSANSRHAHGANKTVWRPEQPPVMDDTQTTITGALRSCDYCGSMHPADVAEAIRKGAEFHWADFKYGWPHKAYGDNIPNPHAGLPEVRSSTNRAGDPNYPREVREPRYDHRTGERLEDSIWYTEAPKPASAKTWGKFYSVHLMDATPEEREVIERHLRMRFEFTEDGRVSWRPFAQEAGA